MNFYHNNKSLIFSFLSVSIGLFLFFVMAGSNSVKNYLNDLMSDTILVRPHEELKVILPNYLNYLANTAFWIEAGNFPKVVNYKEQDKIPQLPPQVLESLPGVVSITYTTDTASYLLQLQGDSTRIIEKSDTNGHILPVPKGGKTVSTGSGKTIFISDFYVLPQTGEGVFSIVLEMETTPRAAISLDISIRQFLDFYKGIFGEDSILFWSFNNNKETIIIPLDKKSIGELVQQQPETTSFYEQMISEIVVKKNTTDVQSPFRLEYQGKDWIVISSNNERYGNTGGFIIPESRLFFSQFNQLYMIMSLPFFLLFLILIALFFGNKHKEKKQSSDEDLLLKLIEQGEGKELEFKSSLRWDYRENRLNKKLEEVILKSIAAFANGYGGVLLIGVDDAGNPTDLQNDYKTFKNKNRDGFELHLRNLASSMYGTFAVKNMEVKFISIDGKDICRITISKSPRPLFTTMKNQSGEKLEHFYVRDGNMCRRIDSLKRIINYCKRRFT